MVTDGTYGPSPASRQLTVSDQQPGKCPRSLAHISGLSACHSYGLLKEREKYDNASRDGTARDGTNGAGVTDVWLIDETQPLSTEEALEARRSVLGFEDYASRPPIAVTISDVTIHNTRRLFGAAEVRIDALLVTATADDQIYHPGTFVFPGVRDHDQLPIAGKGILVYLGSPRYFLDISLIASQGGSDKTLGELLAENACELGDLLGNVAQLAIGVPQVAAITGAAAAAAKLAAVGLQLLNEITGKSIGLYRVTWFEHRDRFGLGPHPSNTDRFRNGDFEFRYEIFEDTPAELPGTQ